MVTNLTARRGVGNRPGLWNLPSGPKHPYGKRLMVLPVWAWARGKLYPQVVMQDGHEEWMGFHESTSTPDPYYCRPMGIGEVDVDAISCPTKVFNSAKGRLAADLPKVPYPPRNDLMQFLDRDCDVPSSGAMCSKSAEQFKTLNDLDAVAAATPPFEQVFEGQWSVASQLRADADYALVVEVNREFDQNAHYRPTAYEDRMLSDNGFTQTGLAQQPRPALGCLPGTFPDRRHGGLRGGHGHRGLRRRRRRQRIDARARQHDQPDAGLGRGPPAHRPRPLDRRLGPGGQGVRAPGGLQRPEHRRRRVPPGARRRRWP